MQPAGTPPTPARPPNRSWVWFFLLLAAAGAGAVVTPIVYNLRQQLRPEQFEAARARWEKEGPADYDLVWEAKDNREPRPTEYHVIVRGGAVCAVYENGRLLLGQELAAPLGGAVGATLGAVDRAPRRELTGYTVEALFREMEGDLKASAETGGKDFATASFDPRDGHPIRYIHRVKRSSQRLEWNIRLVRP
jgi:hypothetical protein